VSSSPPNELFRSPHYANEVYQRTDRREGALFVFYKLMIATTTRLAAKGVHRCCCDAAILCVILAVPNGCYIVRFVPFFVFDRACFVNVIFDRPYLFLCQSAGREESILFLVERRRSAHRAGKLRGARVEHLHKIVEFRVSNALNRRDSLCAFGWAKNHRHWTAGTEDMVDLLV